MTTINDQEFAVGDTVNFGQATLPRNRDRDYRITAISADGIKVETHGGSPYTYSLADATRLGITRAQNSTGEPTCERT